MANSDKDILITPNTGSSSADPKIEYVGADSSGNDTITVETLYDGTKATLSFEGSAGQLFSVVNDLTSDPIFSVNDVSGIPSIEVDSDGEIRLAEFSGNVGIGTSSPGALLDVNDENAVSRIRISRGGTDLSTSTDIGSLDFYADFSSSPIHYGGLKAYANNLSGVRGSLDFYVKSTSGNVLTGMTLYGTNSGVNVGIGTQTPSSLLDVDGLITANNLTLQNLSAQNSEATAVMIDGSGIIGTRELGSNAFNSTAFLTGNQTITLSGDVSGSGTTSIAVTIADDSHNHVISNVDGLQTALDAKLPLAGGTLTGNLTLGGYLAGPATFTIDPAAVGDNTGTVVIAGNLQVDGTTTTINSTTLTVDDKLITLASGSLNAAAADGAGIEVEISGATYPSIKYDGTNDEWDFNKDINVTGAITSSGDLTIPNKIIHSGDTDTYLHFANADDFRIVTGNSTRAAFNNSKIHFNQEGINQDFQVQGDTDTSLLYVDASADMVGIGTSSPSSKLHVSGSSNVEAKIESTNDNAILRISADSGGTGTGGNEDPFLIFQSGGTDVARIYHDNSVNALIFDNNDTTERMRIDASGNVGIGTSSPAQKLHIDGFALFENNDEIRFKDSGGTQRTAIAMSSNDLNIGTSAGGNLKFYNGSTYVERMRIDASGNVGIGNTNPNGKLHIGSGSSSAAISGSADDLVLDNAGNAGLTIATGNTAVASLFFADTGSNASGYIQYTHSNDALAFATNNAQERMRIDSSGRVGIGITTPNNKLTVSGASDGINIVGTSSYLRWNSGDMMIRNEGSYAMGFHTYDGSSAIVERMRIDSSGNVGIGTASPARPLDIVSTDQIGIQYTNSTASSTARLYVTAGTSSGILQQYGNTHSTNANEFRIAASAGDITLAPSSTERVRITTSGNVGIGTSSPAYKLEVESSSDADLIQIQSTAGANNTVLRLGISGDVATLNASGGSSGELAIKTYGTERMRIDTSGNIGIGTNNPYTLLELSSIDPIIRMTDSNGVADKSIYEMRAIGASGYESLEFRSVNDANSVYNKLLVLKHGGNVGIGTDSPIAKQHNLITSSGTALLLNNSLGGSGAYVDLDFNTYNVTVTGYANAAATIRVIDDGNYSGNITFRTKANAVGGSQTERMRITSGGNVGIGETSPLGKLHVKTGDSGAGVNVNADELVVESSGTAGITILSGTSGDGNIFFDDSGGFARGKLSYSHNGDYLSLASTGASIFYNGGSEAMRIDSSGNIIVSGTVDGRDVAADGTKLDTIATNADVTPSWVPSSDPSYATQSYVGTQISNLVDSAPGTLDTLNELAAALGDDANFSTTVTNSIATKAPIESPSFTTKITTPSIHNSGKIGILNGTSAQGIRVLSLYAGTTYASDGSASGMVDTLNGYRVQGAQVIDSSGNWVGGGNISEFTNNSGYTTASGNNTFTGRNKIVIQNSTDGGTSAGLYLWNSSDPNWVIYMGQSGSGKSAAGGTAATSIDGRTAHHIRYRVNTNNNQGHLWENNSDQTLMSLGGDNGYLYTRGNIYPSNQTTNYVDSTRIANWQTAYGWGNHASAGYQTAGTTSLSNYLRKNQNDTLSSTLKVTGSIIHEFNTTGGYIARPKGAQYVTSTGAVTGAIKIKLPTHGTDDMMSFWVDIYDYSTGESVTLWIGGYLYQTTGNNEWVNTTALIFTEQTGKAPENVRFGADGSTNCIWIGETTDTWSYPQVIVRDFQCGYSADVDAYDDNWAITFVTSFDTVDDTHVAKGPVTEWDRVEGKPTIPTNNNQLTNGAGYITGNQTITLSGDVSGSGTTSIAVTIADDSHNHIISNVDGLQTALDGKLSTTGTAANSQLLDSLDSSQFLRSDADDTVSKQLTFPSAIGDRPILQGGFLSRLSSDGDADIWGISEDYYPSQGTASSAWGIRWASSPNEIQFVGANQNKLRIDLDTAGKVYIDNNEVWHAGNDGSGSGLDADLLDGINSGSFARSDAGTTYSNYANVQRFYSNTNIATASGTQSSLEVYTGASGNDAFMSFHVNGDYATYFGLDGGTNKLSTGGWSAGATSNTVWHAGVDGSGSGLDADLLDGYEGSNYVGKNGNTYYQADTWIQFNGTYALYVPTVNNAHLVPNTVTSYGTWRTLGSRGGYDGIMFDDGGNMACMWDGSGNGGFYQQSGAGWTQYFNVSNSCTGFGGSSTSSSYEIYVSGAIYATGDVVAYSDKRVKENIVPIDNALEKVNGLQGVYYNRIDDENKTKEIGFIAQEVNEVAPELVTYAEDVDQYGVKYGNTTALLVEAVKELTQQVKDLKQEIEEIKNVK